MRSFTFQLNVSAFCGTRGVWVMQFRGIMAGVEGMLGRLGDVFVFRGICGGG